MSAKRRTTRPQPRPDEAEQDPNAPPPPRPTYHGPTGDPTDPESAALVTRYQELKRKVYEDE